MNNQLPVFRSEGFNLVLTDAPQAYTDNTTSHDRCIEAGQALLRRAETEGMNENLDRDIAVYIERTRKTLRKMNDKRTPVTQLFDTIRSAYTALENAVDPAKAGTVPARLQQLRNDYAAEIRRRQAEEQRQRQIEQLHQAALTQYQAELRDHITSEFNEHVTKAVEGILDLERTLTLDNKGVTVLSLRTYDCTLPISWLKEQAALVTVPDRLTQTEADKIAADVVASLHPTLSEQYGFETSSTCQEVLDRLPSRLEELGRMAKASEQEAAAIQRQIKEREEAERAEREQAAAERQAKDQAAKQLAAKQREMDSLFSAAQASVPDYQPKTDVRRRIRVTAPAGFMDVVGMWWAQLGCTLTVDELNKIFSRQLTFCNKLANDKKNPVLIHSDTVVYDEEVKAK